MARAQVPFNKRPVNLTMRGIVAMIRNMTIVVVVITTMPRSLLLVRVRIWLQMHEHIPDTDEPFHELIFDQVSDVMPLINGGGAVQ